MIYDLWVLDASEARVTGGFLDLGAIVDGGAHLEVFSGTFDGTVSIEDGSSAGLRRNLLRLVEIAKQAGGSLYLMTYPSRRGYYPFASQEILAVAEKSGAPLIDLDAVFAPICPQIECPAVLLQDGHPNPEGYRLIAETILARLAARGSP